MAVYDPMSEAGRKVIYLHFTRMLANEADTRLGEDPEALHDMRVATRRMRAAFALFGPHFDKKVLKQFGKGLRQPQRSQRCAIWMCCWTARARRESPPERRLARSAAAHWGDRRRSPPADARLSGWLGLSAFVADFGAFLTAPAGAARSRR
jgi:hypothetical protein